MSLDWTFEICPMRKVLAQKTALSCTARSWSGILLLASFSPSLPLRILGRIV